MFVNAWSITALVVYKDAPTAVPMFGVVRVIDDAILAVVTAPVEILAAVIEAAAMSSVLIAPASKFAPADKFSTNDFTVLKFPFI